MSKKLGIIVPYRNRHNHLKQFLDYVPKYLRNRNYDYEIIVVNQDNASAFNRGMLCNIGFVKAKLLGCDYVVFHDVDMLPVEVDYSYDNKPVHLATDNLPFNTYFGGMTLFPVEDFESINGFSNLYWGWGFEDDDLRYRCAKKHLRFKRKIFNPLITDKSTLRYNGVDAYSSINNQLKYTKDFTINIRATLDKIILNHREVADKYTFFNIEGYDFDISYTSFGRYQVQFFDSKNNFYQIFSNIEKEREVFLSVTYSNSNKKISFFIDGILIGSVVMDAPLKNYSRTRDIFLGSDHKLENLFRGTIQEVSIYQTKLDINTIKLLTKNYKYSLSSNFLDYSNAEDLICYLDSKYIKDYKFVDLSGNNTINFLANVEQVIIENRKVIEYIPYRRDSKIKFLKHENNGFNYGRWKDDLTRWNQLRFVNEVERGFHNTNKDGLASLTYTLHGEIKKPRYTHLNVGI